MAWNESFGSDHLTVAKEVSEQRAPSPLKPPPEDGLRLIRAFVGIRQPAVREAIIEFVTKLSAIDDHKKQSSAHNLEVLRRP